jgi:probable F420-dependent oxidoreductase
MRIGVTFPQTGMMADPIAVRDYAQAAEDLGYTHLLAYDHVLGADTTHRPHWTGPYDLHSLFHEPFVLFGYLAGLTRRLEFVTAVLVLPQRQTALVAKQAAEVDVLSQGRLRLGVGVGWNEVEYQALNESFSNRGKRIEEQIMLMRAFFTQRSVSFHGRWHTVEEAGINPLPVQRPVPIWLGGSSEATLRRVAALADGWFPRAMPVSGARAMIEQLHDYAREVGRNLESIGIEPRITIAGKTPDEWVREVQAWREMGATYAALNTMNAGLASPQEHIDGIRRFHETISAMDGQSSFSA